MININNPAESIKKICNDSDFKKVSVVGHSIGGFFAIKFAASFPESVDRLFLIDSEGVYEKEKIESLFINFARTHLKHGKAKALNNIKSVYNLLKNPLFMIRLVRLAHLGDLTGDLFKISAKTTIIWGREDRLTPVWQGEIMNKFLRNSKLIVLAGMDHDWILHKPQLFWENYK